MLGTEFCACSTHLDLLLHGVRLERLEPSAASCASALQVRQVATVHNDCTCWHTAC